MDEKVHPEMSHDITNKKLLKSPPEFASNPPLGEHETISFFYLLIFFFFNLVKVPQQVLYFLYFFILLKKKI
jgi:hypothetical protein